MLKPTIEKALNDQINMEFYSSYIYLSMAAWFNDQSYPGFANWMEMQSQEELEHGMKLFNYVHDRGGKIVLQAIDQPKSEWASTLEAFTDSYNHECKVSRSIDEIVTLARNESDHSTDNFLQWFVAEQVEEEATVDQLVQQLKHIQDAPAAIYMLDRELATRKAGTEEGN